MKILIYRITNSVNEKPYIGQTSRTLEIRFNSHKYSKKKNGKLYKAIKKHGIEKFKIEEIDCAFSKEQADNKEIFWIKHYDAIDNGYNIHIGGNCQSGENNNFFGKHHTEESINKIKKGNKNKVFSEDYRKKLSKAATDRILKNPVICITNGITYISATEAARSLNLDKSQVSRVLNGKQRHSKGFVFKYEE